MMMLRAASQVQSRVAVHVLVACAIAITVAVTLAMQPAAVSAQTDGVVAYEGARLITGDGSAAIENGVIVVRSGVIDAVGASGSVTVPRGAQRVDLRGKTVMPMLVNVHGHIGYMKGATTEQGELQPRERARPPAPLYLLRRGRLPVARHRSRWDRTADPR